MGIYINKGNSLFRQTHNSEYMNYPHRAKPCETDADILLVAVTYDKKTKEHRCEIEAMKL